jgi:hypothetical protein
LDLAGSLLEMAQIPVVKQDFLSYFTYLICTHPSGLSQLQELTENRPIEVSLPPNGSIDTMTTIPTMMMAFNGPNNPPA